MGTTKQFSSITCELKIIEAKNLRSIPNGNLFVRCYLPCGLGNKTSTKLDTQEIPTKKDHVWDEKFSLECHNIDINKLSRGQKLVFELRLRNIVPLLKTSLGGSKLLGRAEISLDEILNSKNAVLDKWLNMVLTRGATNGDFSECPKLKVEIKARVLEMGEEKFKAKRNWDKCGCRDGQDHDHHGFTCDDYDVFALIVAIEA